MANLNWYQLRHNLARRVGDHTFGTATGGAAQTLVDATRRKERDNVWLGAWLKVYSGTGSGQERPLSASTQSSGTLTHAATAWATNPDNTSLYELHRYYSAADYDEFLKEALRAITRGRRMLDRTVDESLSWTTDQYDYTVPAGVVGISRIAYATETGTPDSDEYKFIPNDQWDIRLATTRKIVFSTKFSQPASTTTIRLHGYKEFADPSADTTTYNLDAGPIVALAAVLVAESLIPLHPTAHWREFHAAALNHYERALARIPETAPSEVRWCEPL